MSKPKSLIFGAKGEPSNYYFGDFGARPHPATFVEVNLWASQKNHYEIPQFPQKKVEKGKATVFYSKFGGFRKANMATKRSHLLPCFISTINPATVISPKKG